MRIAKPLLLITTPIGLIGGVHEAFRLAGGLAFIMIALILVVGAAVGMLVLTIRKEEAAARAAAEAADTQPAAPSQQDISP
jgi:flagellar basal body-associated protein FliL